MLLHYVDLLKLQEKRSQCSQKHPHICNVRFLKQINRLGLIIAHFYCLYRLESKFTEVWFCYYDCSILLCGCSCFDGFSTSCWQGPPWVVVMWTASQIWRTKWSAREASWCTIPLPFFPFFSFKGPYFPMQWFLVFTLKFQLYLFRSVTHGGCFQAWSWLTELIGLTRISSLNL